MTGWVWVIVPLAVWLAVIAVNSTDMASGVHTDALLLKLARLFFSETGEESGGFSALSWFVRKLGHVIEYALLAVLLARVGRRLLPRFVRGGGRELLWRTAAVAVPAGLLVALADELHQTFVSSRTGKLSDVAIDVLGLLAGALSTGFVWQRRNSLE